VSEPGTLTAELRVDEEQVRLAEPDGRRALQAVLGLDAVRARARLRFGPGRTCEPVARLLDRVIVRAEQAGLSPARLILVAGRVEAGEDIVRVRRKAHGTADWIASPTCRVEMALRPAGLHASGGGDFAGQPFEREGCSGGAPLVGMPVAGMPVVGMPAAGVPAGGASANGAGAGGAPDGAVARLPAGPAGPEAGERAAAVREALLDVIDPDLGVNIVDLGFVRQVEVADGTAVITMTLTSAACPLTSIMEDQIRAELAGVGDVSGFRVNWVWLPPWRPADITGSGRDQLRAIGFSV
jgi:metal-sulfur cluster biosynthetic enzyme/ribosomal protein L22